MTSRATAQDLHDELVSFFRRTGEATGYWANYFLREVRKHGGLAFAQKLLAEEQVSSGFERLVAVHRADLSIESIALSQRFQHLFTPKERAVADARLKSLPTSAFPNEDVANRFFATDLDDDEYVEGAVERVTVNSYERNARARAACIRKHGVRCFVCDVDFGERYGKIGEGFIHVHHKTPVARLRDGRRIDPSKDLVPVCPNCHAMLHQRKPPFDIEQMRAMLRSR